MDLLNRALEQVIDQLVTQKISNLKLEIENQKQTILDLSLRIDKRENEIGKKFDDLQRQNRLLMAKILLMENEKILQDSNEIQVQEQQKDQEIITKIETEEAVVSIIPETQRETIDKISELLNAESSNEIGMSVKAYYIQVIH